MRLAARGLRDMDHGPETVTDAVAAEAARVQARRVHVKTMLASVLLTALYLLVS